MAEDQRPWASYRCPVCGHVDGVPVPREAPVHFRCSHCGAELEGKSVSEEAEHLPVQVREDRS